MADKANQMSQPQNTAVIDKKVIEEVRQEKIDEAVKFENKDIQVNSESLNNTCTQMVNPQRKDNFKNMVLWVEDDVFSDKISEKSIQEAKKSHSEKENVNNLDFKESMVLKEDTPGTKENKIDFTEPYLNESQKASSSHNSASSLHLHKDIETRINASLYGKPDSSLHDSKTSSSAQDWASIGLYKLFNLLYTTHSKGSPHLDEEGLRTTDIPESLTEFVFRKYAKNGPKIFDEVQANAALKYVKKGIKQRMDRTVGDSSDGWGHKNQSDVEFRAQWKDYFSKGMDTLRYLMNLLGLSKNYSKIVMVYDNESVEDVMKWLMRWCKVYDGIEVLGQIFLLIKNLEEINSFLTIQENDEKLQEKNINIEEIKSEIQTSLTQKIR
jgi:hypothetical protein